MKRLMEMLRDHQYLNTVDKGISFTEEGFNELYDEALIASANYKEHEGLTGVQGIIIGAAGMGLTWLGVEVTKKIVKVRRKSKKIEKETDELKGKIEKTVKRVRSGSVKK